MLSWYHTTDTLSQSIQIRCKVHLAIDMPHCIPRTNKIKLHINFSIKKCSAVCFVCVGLKFHHLVHVSSRIIRGRQVIKMNSRHCYFNHVFFASRYLSSRWWIIKRRTGAKNINPWSLRFDHISCNALKIPKFIFRCAIIVFFLVLLLHFFSLCVMFWPFMKCKLLTFIIDTNNIAPQHHIGHCFTDKLCKWICVVMLSLWSFVYVTHSKVYHQHTMCVCVSFRSVCAQTAISLHIVSV